MEFVYSITYLSRTYQENLNSTQFNLYYRIFFIITMRTYIEECTCSVDLSMRGVFAGKKQGPDSNFKLTPFPKSHLLY